MDTDQTATTNADGFGGNPNGAGGNAAMAAGGRPQLGSEANAQAASQLGDNFMLAGLSTGRGGDGELVGSGIDQSASRYGQNNNHGVDATQSQSNFDPSAYNMMGGLPQPNAGSLPSLQPM